MSETKETKIRQLVNQRLTPVQMEEVKNKLGWTEYQWTWFLNHPRKWKLEMVAEFCLYIGVDWRTLVKDYELGYDKLAPLLELDKEEKVENGAAR